MKGRESLAEVHLRSPSLLLFYTTCHCSASSQVYFGHVSTHHRPGQEPQQNSLEDKRFLL